MNSEKSCTETPTRTRNHTTCTKSMIGKKTIPINTVSAINLSRKKMVSLAVSVTKFIN